MFNLYNARASHFMPLTAVITMTVFRLFGFANVGGNGGVVAFRKIENNSSVTA